MTLIDHTLAVRSCNQTIFITLLQEVAYNGNGIRYSATDGNINGGMLYKAGCLKHKRLTHFLQFTKVKGHRILLINIASPRMDALVTCR